MPNTEDRIAIDRMSGKPYGYRDDSDAGCAEDFNFLPWTIDEVREKAVRMGKSFEPNPEITGRLAADLADQQVIVLFMPEDVTEAVEQDLIPQEWLEDLIEMVSPEGKNDIAIIPAGAVEEKKQRQELMRWFLTNNRC